MGRLLSAEGELRWRNRCGLPPPLWREASHVAGATPGIPDSGRSVAHWTGMGQGDGVMFERPLDALG